MRRRSFVLAAGAAVLAGASLPLYRRWQEVPPTLVYPGREEGHLLRDLAQQKRTLPLPTRVIETNVAILGAGIAGLSAAWKLQRDGHQEFLMIDGPQPFGNAAGGHFGELAYPTGSHYLPLPSAESVHVREMLADLGVIQRDPLAAQPYYDERVILHGPDERLLFNGSWQEGLVPATGVAEWELREHRRFFAEVRRLRQQRGDDGRRLFVLPSALASQDPAWLALDQITLRFWLEQNDYRSPTLHWYLNYCCRDDYGRRYDEVSAWAGLHYFCSRFGNGAANAAEGAWLTWPGGLAPLAELMARSAQGRRHGGSVVSLKQVGGQVEALCLRLVNGQPQTYLVRARKAICAMPLQVAARVVDNLGQFGFDAAAHMPQYAPWLVANFLLKRFPAELPHAPLSWDNVVYQEPGLGYVVSTHQDIRVQPPAQSVFTAYVALSDRTPAAARQWMDTASGDELLALVSADLKAAYGDQFAACVERVEITLRAHAMAVPLPGFRSNPGLRALREQDGAILFAHADLSGFSLFEEASWWGYRAAQLAVK